MYRQLFSNKSNLLSTATCKKAANWIDERRVFVSRIIQREGVPIDKKMPTQISSSGLTVIEDR